MWLPDKKKATARSGTVWTDWLSDEFKEQQDRKNSIEQRGLAVISTSGTLVALILGLSALISGRLTVASAPPLAVRVTLVVTLAMFVAAAFLGLVVAYPRLYPEIPIDELRLMVTDERWELSDDLAAKGLAEARVGMLEATRQLNGKKAVLLSWALGAEVAGVVATAISVSLVLTMH